MAKIALIFLFAFCVFQISTAARITRDAPAAPAAGDDVSKAFDASLQQMTQFLEKTFSKENLEKVGASLKEFGEQISVRGKELVEQADAGIKKLQTKE